jgi:hypothetical protein
MNPGRYDFQLFRGTTFERDIRIETNESDPAGYPGYTPRLTLRKVMAGNVVAAANTSWQQDDPTSGIIRINLTVSKTLLLTSDRYVYDLEIEHTDGTVLRILNGIFKVSS